jgi:hypothetical protein
VYNDESSSLGAHTLQALACHHFGKLELPRFDAPNPEIGSEQGLWGVRECRCDYINRLSLEARITSILSQASTQVRRECQAGLYRVAGSNPVRAIAFSPSGEIASRGAKPLEGTGAVAQSVEQMSCRLLVALLF